MGVQFARNRFYKNNSTIIYFVGTDWRQCSSTCLSSFTTTVLTNDFDFERILHPHWSQQSKLILNRIALKNELKCSLFRRSASITFCWFPLLWFCTGHQPDCSYPHILEHLDHPTNIFRFSFTRSFNKEGEITLSKPRSLRTLSFSLVYFTHKQNDQIWAFKNVWNFVFR